MILCCGVILYALYMPCSIPGLFSLGVTDPQAVKTDCRHCQLSPGGQNCPEWEALTMRVWKKSESKSRSVVSDYTVRGILQARILECVAVSFSRGSSQPMDRTQVSCIPGGFFTSWATREAHRGYNQGKKLVGKFTRIGKNYQSCTNINCICKQRTIFQT